MRELIMPVVQTAANESHQLVYFLLGCFVTYHLMKANAYRSKVKAFLITEFNGIKK